MARLVLDSGAVIGLARGEARVAGAIRISVDRGDDVIVPPVVVAQTIRGGPRDALIHRLLNAVRVPPTGLRLARRAGELLGAARTSDAADALIMAEALRGGPAILLTSDVDDMERLAGNNTSVRIIRV